MVLVKVGGRGGGEAMHQKHNTADRLDLTGYYFI